MNLKNFVCGSLLVCAMTACGPENKNLKEYDHDSNTILWENVSADYNPQVSQNDMDVKDVQKIIVNVPSAADKVNVIYSATLPADTAIIKVYTISKDSLTSSGLRRGRVNNIIEMSDRTQSCNLKAAEGRIKYLKGYCYARIDVHLREGAAIEVYSGSRIITNHFQTISLVELMSRMHESQDDTSRLQNVADFAASYSETSQRASIYTSDLTAILRQFQATAPKLQTLRLLHIYVTDRDQLENMIETEFEYFDRAEARRIVGLSF
ncbi:DUF4476 domain-containing protein [Bdellovibrio sp. SKB1291214]|uniref:DUF4476 domain-containing protein n=1 Tax=Bdellovibrio sp. SKB1291214 TaxID=1732569 RepID=UPI000B517378|nr:DUF4476 domain-containing protein [Bdellovibrio sp. SKB1291214]UYL07804.1 DUF4476 domain-containing protein [Bdellovibrio sp. SKB1291214]